MQTSVIRFIVCTGLLLFSLSGWAQSPADSLENLLPNLEGETKVDALSELCWLLTSSNPAKAGQYGRQAIALAQEIDYQKGLAQAYNDLGILQIYTPNLDSALWYFDHSLEIRQALNDEEGIASIYNKKGIVYKYKGLLERAIDNFLKTIDYYSALGMQLELGMSYNNIAVCYTDLNESDKALEFYQKALEIKRETNNLNEIGGTLSNIGSIQFELGQYAQAKATFEEALSLLEQSGSQQYMGMTYNGLGAIAIQEGNPAQALDYFRQAHDISIATNNRLLTLSTRIKQGRLLLEMGNLTQSKQYLEEAKAIAESENMRLELRDIYSLLATISEKQRDFASAYQYNRQVLAIQDTLYDQERNKLIAEMQTQFETEQKEQENELLAAENQIQALELERTKRQNREQAIIFGGIATLLLLIGGIGYNRYRLRVQKEHAAQQKQWFQAVVEAEDKERKRIAMELHDGLGQVLSTAKLNIQCLEDAVQNADPEEQTNYSNAVKLIDDSCIEVRNISHNLMPGALTKMGLAAALRDLAGQVNQARQVTVQTELDFPREALSENQEIAIFRIVQELINNSLKHSEASKINCSVTTNNKELDVWVGDDGKGTTLARLKESTGIGWKNLNSRISLLNGKLTVNTAPGEGTQYRIQVPLQNQLHGNN